MIGVIGVLVGIMTALLLIACLLERIDGTLREISEKLNKEGANNG